MKTHTVRKWVLHDYLQVNGGAERLAVALTRNLPGFSLGVSGIYEGFVRSGDLGGLVPHAPGLPLAMLPRIPRALWAFGGGAFPVGDTECVIYSGLYAPLAVRRQAGGRKVYYCHTPPRFAFEEQDRYLRRVPAPARPLLRAAISRYRDAYLESIRAMDTVLANSVHTRDRLLRQTGLSARVVFPPVDTDAFRFLGQRDYYLSVGRLEPDKRIDVVVRAFIGMPQKNLVVVSGGSRFAALKALAGDAPNIRIMGWLDEARLRRFVGEAIAVIYIPRNEDFGMSAIEAMAAGKPVIGVDEGGLRETVLDGRTGVLLPPDPAPSAVAGAVARLTPQRAGTMRAACEARARDFSLERFVSAFRGLLG